MMRRAETFLLPPLLLLVVVGALIQARTATADSTGEDAASPNCISVRLGGQVKLAQYKTGFALAGSYSRWLSGISWLDFGSTILVHKDTNLRFDGGLRWKFGRSKGNVRAFLRAGLEVGILLEGQTRGVIAARGGGGAGYYLDNTFGLTIEAGISVGPAFGDGVHVASALDFMVGGEFPF